MMGLLVARMLCPQTRRMAAHWSMTEDGAVPPGNFGRFMPRNRFQDILRDLHFVDNKANHGRDKLWKIRPIVDTIQRRFLCGWTLTAVFSFDEGVLPSTSKRNTTRMFMPDKPHRYGSKMFMLCDQRTAYCHRYALVFFSTFLYVVYYDYRRVLTISMSYYTRFDVYAGKRNQDEATVDMKTGAASVVRNLKTALEPHSRHPWHAVVIDRFYSSVLLAVELLSMNVYVIGTIMTSRLGYDKNVVSKSKSRPASIPRGTFTFSRSGAIPNMVRFTGGTESLCTTCAQDL